METLDTNPLQPPAPETPQSQGFGSLTTHSFQVLFKNIHHYLILSFIILIPVAIVGTALYFWAQPSLAAPKLPGANEIPPVIEEVIGDPVIDLAEDPVEDSVVEPTEENGLPVGADFTGEPSSLEDGFMKFETESIPTSIGMVSVGFLAGTLGIVLLILMIPFILYQFFVMLAFFRLTALINKREAISYGGILKWSLKKIGSFILLMFRIFIYTWAWLFIVLTIVPFVLPITQLLFVIPIVDIALVVIVVVRGLSTVMAQYALADKDCSSKEALQYSIEISKGRRAQIFSYMFILGLIIGLISGSLTFIVNFASELTAAIISFIISILFGYYMIIFMMGYYRLLEMWYGAKNPGPQSVTEVSPPTFPASQA